MKWQRILVKIYCLIGLLLFASSGWISPAAAQNAQDRRVIVAIGTGSISGGNAASAREKAIADSLVSAIEQVTAEILPLEVMVNNFQMLDEIIFRHTESFVQGYRVLGEAVSGDKYRVLVETTIPANNIRTQLLNIGLLAKRQATPRVLFVISEQNADDVIPRYWWGEEPVFAVSLSESTIAEVLQGKGYVVVDHGRRFEAMGYPLQLTDADAIDIGKSFEADVIIVGEAMAKLTSNIMGSDIRSFEGRVEVRALRVEDGKPIAASAYKAVATSADERQGGREALANAAALIGDDLAVKIAAAWQLAKEKTNQLEVSITGTGNLSHFVKFRQRLSNITGVAKIGIREMAANNARLTVQYTGSPRALAEALMLRTFQDFGINIYDITDETLNVELVPQ